MVAICLLPAGGIILDFPLKCQCFSELLAIKTLAVFDWLVVEEFKSMRKWFHERVLLPGLMLNF